MSVLGFCGVEGAFVKQRPFRFFPELEQMSISQLNELLMEMETIIRELSETLISELALRDECEYEKEMKNSFISLLLAVQNRRRQFHVEKKKGKAQGKQPTPGMGNFFAGAVGNVKFAALKFSQNNKRRVFVVIH